MSRAGTISRATITAFSLMATYTAAAGKFRVVDGDTIKSGDITYRLEGIDAPEAGQTCKRAGVGRWRCGNVATTRMEKLTSNRDVTCETHGKDDYGRDLATCRSDGTNINEIMVREGLAWAFRRYSTRYVALEDQIRSTGRGIWQAETETPWDFRARRWQVTKQDAPAGCPIKGNISKGKRERIYHTPWSRDYDKTHIDTSEGERWFCSEAEALAAGWRAPLWGK